MTTIPDDIMQAARKLLDTLQWDIDSADADCERIARAILAERERCAKVADEIMTTADGKFDLRVLRALQGENNLELAAACAAGMSHAAREIAVAIRSGDHE